MSKEQDHIGHDPVIWIERLQYVNDTSLFTEDEQKLINDYFVKLKSDLQKLYS